MIDLSKLAPRELPTREIAVVIGGEPQTATIHPLNGAGKIALAELAQRIEPGNLSFSPVIIRLALLYGADLSETEAGQLIDADPEAAIALGNAVWGFEGAYTASKEAERSAAEKNSGMAEGNTED